MLAKIHFVYGNARLDFVCAQHLGIKRFLYYKLHVGCQNQTSVHAVKPHCCAEILHKSLRVLLHPSAELEPDLHRKPSFIFFFFVHGLAKGIKCT